MPDDHKYAGQHSGGLNKVTSLALILEIILNLFKKISGRYKGI